MSPTLVCRSGAYSFLLAACFSSCTPAAEPATRVVESVEEPELDDVWLQRIAELPRSADGWFEFRHAAAVPGNLRLRVNGDDAVLLLHGRTPELGPAVHATIPIDSSIVAAVRGGGRTGWLEPPPGTTVRGVRDAETVVWNLRRLALTVSAEGLVHGRFELQAIDGGPDDVADGFGRLLGSCESISDDGVVRMVARPEPGSLCEEVMWL